MCWFADFMSKTDAWMISLSLLDSGQFRQMYIHTWLMAKSTVLLTSHRQYDVQCALRKTVFNMRKSKFDITITRLVQDKVFETIVITKSVNFRWKIFKSMNKYLFVVHWQSVASLSLRLVSNTQTLMVHEAHSGDMHMWLQRVTYGSYLFLL